MGLSNLLKKKNRSGGKQESKMLLAMAMFNAGERYKLDLVIDNIKSFWGLTISEIEGEDEIAAFKIDGEIVTLSYVPVQIPCNIEEITQHTYNWVNATEELKNHNGCGLVSVLPGSKTQAERFKILSKVICSVLLTSKAIGIYQGEQSLLISKELYLEHIRILKGGLTPVGLCIYFGLRASDKGNSVFTFGLAEFGKKEIEIINSKLQIEELYAFANKVASYVIESNENLQDGETIGHESEQQVKIKSSRGIFVEGQTLKLEM